MRWLWRSLAFWAISLPLFYQFGLPALLDRLSAKAAHDGYAQCLDHMREQGLMGTPGSPLTPERVDHYCHCVSDGLIFTRADLFDMVQKKSPAALTALATEKSTRCTSDLQRAIDTTPTANPKEIIF